MKKIKIKQRFENAVDAFFAGENSGENNSISFVGDSDILRDEFSIGSSKKIGNLETILKQVFLFFPGTFVLYILSMGFTVMFISALVRPTGMTPRFGTGWLMLLFLAAASMTWLGLGDVRKPKHFVIPASIIGVGVVFGSFVSILITIPQIGRLFFRDAFPLYVFPLALVVPFLAKGWVDRKIEK